MASDYTQAGQQFILDAAFPSGATAHTVAWSVNGTSQWAGLARTAIGSYAAATATNPSWKSNAAKLTSAASTAAGTVSHYATFTAASGGTQLSVWKPLSASVSVALGGKLEVNAGDLDLSV